MAEAAKWYVVHTYSGYENKVATTLEKTVENRKLQDLIADVKIPTEKVVELQRWMYFEGIEEAANYVSFVIPTHILEFPFLG